MNRIIIDMSPIIYGSRAVKRCTASMVNELMKYEETRLNLLYFDYKYQTDKYLKPVKDHVRQTVIPVPYRLLVPFWKRFSFPYLEMFFCKGDLFYTNEFYFPPTKGVLTLATIHGLSYKVIPGRLPSENVHLFNQGLLFILKHADYLVAVSETTRNELIQYTGVDPQRIYVVTHGVDKRFRRLSNHQEVRDRLKENYELIDPYILYVGAIGTHKNILGILSAYNLLAHKTAQHLVLAGPPDSAWDSSKRYVAEKNLSDRVHFLGHIYETDQLVDLYNGADLFVFPSFYEGWTSPPLEAMACGTPVITSSCSSLPETVGDAAIKVEPENTTKLADEIKNVLNDRSLRDGLVKKGLAHSAFHSWEKAADKLMGVFGEIRTRGPWKGKRV
ncbi:glycosyltransferase family 4 protein [Thermodesulfobacteriota bacterium]